MKNIFFNTNNQKVLEFLVENNKEPKAASEIQSAMKISKGGLNLTLRFLVKTGLLERITRGKTYLYQARVEHPVVKQFKVLSTTIKLYPLVKKIAPHIQKIILFGSTSRGENLPDSDIDLLIITHEQEELTKILGSFKNLPLKPIMKTPLGFGDLKKKDPTFYLEVIRGIILFEKNE